MQNLNYQQINDLIQWMLKNSELMNKKDYVEYSGKSPFDIGCREISEIDLAKDIQKNHWFLKFWCKETGRITFKYNIEQEEAELWFSVIKNYSHKKVQSIKSILNKLDEKNEISNDDITLVGD